MDDEPNTELVDLLVDGVYQEGKRFVELKALAFFSDVIRGVRRIAWVFYLSIVSFVLLTAGVFLVVVECVNQFQSSGTIYFDVVVVVGALLTFVMFSVTTWLLNEKRWISAFRLKPETRYSQIDRQELAVLIDELVVRRIKETQR